MSDSQSRPPHEDGTTDDRQPIQRLAARTADVGGISINRILPQRARRLIGAWCFLDHAGPAIFSADDASNAGPSPGNRGMRVGPHPHTGLQTFTWMLAGEILHRDSLGSEQVIRPGELNLMTAGHGIAHTEESLADSHELHAAQLWIALPYQDRHTQPRFDHYNELPRWTDQGADFTLLTGAFLGHQAPTLAFSPLVGIDLFSPGNSHPTLPLRTDFEYGVLVLEGRLTLGKERFDSNELAYLGSERLQVELALEPGTRVLLMGGEPFGDSILLWWNFVGHNKAEIIEAQRQWEAGDPRFGEVPGFDGQRLMPPPIPWATSGN